MRWIIMVVVGFQLLCVPGFAAEDSSRIEAREKEPGALKRFLVLPVREDVMRPLVFVVRRGVKLAMEEKADLLVLDMETNGGRVDLTEEIIGILGQFKGDTVTFVNRKAFSAGAFIAVATRRIFMAEQSVIGAAAPIMMAPGGGVEGMPDTVERKMTSGISALVRATAEKNGHNTEVIEAMVDKTKELKIGDKVINEKGSILTLTNLEAERTYGDPARPLLSSGTFSSIDALLAKLGYSGAQRISFSPTGAEKMASWITTLSPLLLILGVAGLYLEFKTPGFGLPGIVGISAFLLYFLGGYLAGLSGMEWAVVFVLGVILVGAELFFFPAGMVLGLAGAFLMFISVVMAMLDFYPGAPVLPSLPQQLGRRAMDLIIAMGGSVVLLWLLAKLFPNTSLYGKFVSSSASGALSTERMEERQASGVGRIGVTTSPLRPGGKARFGDEFFDVLSQGELIPKGTKVRIVRYSGPEAVVESVD